MRVIDIEKLTRDYGSGKGIFDVSFQVNEGEVFGFLGPNGAGKTTTIRHLMGFIKAKSGRCTIRGMDCWQERCKIQEHLGYIPGEISFFDDMTGTEYLKFLAGYRRLKTANRMAEMMDRFELDPKSKIKKMSKGTKQKLGIVAAFMHDPEILILDEPTTGLDPLMQSRFVELLAEEKSKGKTILLSSHIFPPSAQASPSNPARLGSSLHRRRWCSRGSVGCRRSRPDSPAPHTVRPERHIRQKSRSAPPAHSERSG